MRKIIKKIDKFEVYMFCPVIGFLIYIYFYERDVFPKGMEKGFLITFRPTYSEDILTNQVCLRQGYRFFPGAAKKLLIK